jgi:hypothetical protein
MKQRECRRAQKSITRCRQREIFVAWGHARFGFSVKIFLTEKEK